MVNIAGYPVKEDAAVSEMQRWNIDRVYGSYGTRPIDEPAVLYAWNEKLDSAGIESQILLSENTWIYPENRTNLLEIHIHSKLIDFNSNAVSSAEAYDALHLDVEPHGLPEWDTATPAERNTLLLYLRDMFHDVRLYLDTHAGSHIPVYADLPVWFDHLSDSTGWTNEADRDAWFDALADSLDGISLMAYERPSLSSISNGVYWELMNFAGEVRIGLDADIGSNDTWTSFSSYTGMLRRVETELGVVAPTDIYNFYKFEGHSPAKSSSISNMVLANGELQLTLAGLTPGKSNDIEYADNIHAGNWTGTHCVATWTATTNWSIPITSLPATVIYRIRTR
jgi:hypothetical protein